MAITLTRTSTPRFGSRNWAKAQKLQWTATRATWDGGYTHGWEIRVGAKLIAIIPDELIGTRPDGEKQAWMENYYGGAAGIGNALYGDLCMALKSLMDADDDSPITFAQA